MLGFISFSPTGLGMVALGENLHRQVHHREQYRSIQMLQLLIAQAIASARFSDVLVVRVWGGEICLVTE